jgi:hypothetical protein
MITATAFHQVPFALIFMMAFITAPIIESIAKPIATNECTTPSKECAKTCFDDEDFSARPRYFVDGILDVIRGYECEYTCKQGVDPACLRCIEQESEPLRNPNRICLAKCPDPNTCIPYDQKFQHLLSRLQQEGFTTEFTTFKTLREKDLMADLPAHIANLSPHRERKGRTESVVYRIFQNGSSVGEAYLVNVPKQKNVPFAVVKTTNRTINLYLYRDASLKRIRFDENGNLIRRIEKVQHELRLPYDLLSCGHICKQATMDALKDLQSLGAHINATTLQTFKEAYIPTCAMNCLTEKVQYMLTMDRYNFL